MNSLLRPKHPIIMTTHPLFLITLITFLLPAFGFGQNVSNGPAPQPPKIERMQPMQPLPVQIQPQPVPMQSPPSLPHAWLIVQVLSDGMVRFGTKALTLNELKLLLLPVANNKCGNYMSQTYVCLGFRPEIPYENLESALEVCRIAGIRKVAVVTVSNDRDIRNLVRERAAAMESQLDAGACP